MVFSKFRMRKTKSETLREIKSHIEGSIQLHTASSNHEDEEEGHSSSAPRVVDVVEPYQRAPQSDTGSTGSNRSLSQLSLQNLRKHQSDNLIRLILVLGALTTAGFLWIGLKGALSQTEDEFIRSALFAENRVTEALDDYLNAASLVHNRCRHNFTRTDFREMYEYLDSSGLVFQAVQFVPNVTNAERQDAEDEAEAYYADNYPNVNYTGFQGFNTPTSGLEPRWRNQSFYFPVQYQEPIVGNEAAIDLDYYSSGSRRQTVDSLFNSAGPALTDRLVLVNEGTKELRCGSSGKSAGYGVVLMHPGVNLTTQPDIWPRDISAIVICIRDLLERSITSDGRDSKIFIHDLSDPSVRNGEPVFLGGAEIRKTTGAAPFVRMIAGDSFASLVDKNLFHQQTIKAANREWTITVVDMEGWWDFNLPFIILGGAIILCSAISLAAYVRNDARKTKRYNELKVEASHEKAALILKNARQATKTERELNDFIAHEVRNPVAAAMAACNFVQTELNKPKPFVEEEALEVAQGDMSVIENALKFVNDLLRNMLDMHRAGNKQLQVNMVATDLKHDVIEPVAGMLHKRGSKVEVIVACPDNLWINADPLRLKQVILNLGRNSSKFIEEGFIRIKAEEVDGNVKLFVDDSGSGIPPEKRDSLFAKFQESLDVLSQGTGIGLYLCKSLVDLMGGKIYLDNDYHSGIEGRPGTSFVIDMRAPSVEPPMAQDNFRSTEVMFAIPGATDEELHPLSEADDLPENLRVLFVDDDSILRKLFKRSVKRIAPQWEVREASNGESALAITEKEEFDLIFVDMYMASVEKQLLGTETVSALRNVGITSKMCGLSANDLEEEYLQAGANAFMFKPFPCEAHELKLALGRILAKPDL
ncbi:unnamed protein product [Cylindrotheca closterium]|uniref:histidine kinase n=1 Tax=Cylindrotheca closterium TaxID=2856 RepID=A0AAD2FU79_9STRA|nr:unnamed protein product [Cylindrotheca closterium]